MTELFCANGHVMGSEAICNRCGGRAVTDEVEVEGIEYVEEIIEEVVSEQSVETTDSPESRGAIDENQEPVEPETVENSNTGDIEGDKQPE